MTMVMKMECEKCTRMKHRTEEEKKDLNRRLKIIAGQVNGISQMIEDDRYCNDVLIQISSTINALKSLGTEMLKSHLRTCVVKDIKDNEGKICSRYFIILDSIEDVDKLGIQYDVDVLVTRNLDFNNVISLVLYDEEINQKIY